MPEVDDEGLKASNKELKQWLVSLNCQQYYTKFVENGITIDLISELDTAALKEIGVKLLGDRLRIEIAISNLKTDSLITNAISNEELQRLVMLHLSGGMSGANISSPILTSEEYHTASTPTGMSKTAHTPTNDLSTFISSGLPYLYGNQPVLQGSSSNLLATSTPNTTLGILPTISNNNSSGTLVLNHSSSTSNLQSDKTVTFILQDGSTKKVSIAGCFNAQSIKRKVLKKLGIKQNSSLDQAYDVYMYNNPQVAALTNSSASSSPSSSLPEGTNLLLDVELVTICYSPDRLEKHRIMLCAKDSTPTESQIETSKKIILRNERLMANLNKKTSKNNMNIDSSRLSEYHIPDQRATSMVAPTLRNFFGQRPPSELISSNLAEYFPEAKQKELEQTVRNSVRYSVRLSRRFNLPHLMNLSSSSSSIYNAHRASVLSNNPPSSIISNEHNKRFPGKTIGEMMLNNINAIDEAAASATLLHSAHNTPSLGKPPSIYSNFSGVSHSGFNQNPNASISNIVSGNSGGNPSTQNDAKSITSVMSSRFSSPNRLSIPANFIDKNTTNNNRYSRIELLSVDSDDDDDFLNNYWDSGDNASDLTGTPSSKNTATLDSMTDAVPKNWLQGARIGAGSFGTVYLGMNPLTGELMAVKQVSLPDENSANHNLQKSMIEALQHEMSLLKELNHENIVRYLGSSTEDKYLNIFLEYVPGGSVLSMLLSYGSFEEPLIRNFIRQVLIGLSYLHGEDIIHRDIKGANILIDIKGTVKISDFGISKKLNSSSSSSSSIEEDSEKAQAQSKQSRRASLQGSVYWMAPEVVKQTAYTKKADIWSVGCLIVEMFTGKHPFPDFSQMQAIFKIGTHITPEIPNWCTREAKDFLEKTFELDYQLRPDAIDMLAEPFLNTLIMSKK